jgi:hypothetical protein
VSVVAGGLPTVSSGPPRSFDRLPDGSFVTLAPSDPAVSTIGPQQIEIVSNWIEALKRRAPMK